MQGLMMHKPLTITSLIQYAAQYHGDTEIVSRSVEGPIHRYDYAACYRRVGRLAHALRRLDLRLGDRVGTLAWNGYRHLELYFAVSGIGAICHTINPRLFEPQIRYIVRHAGDRVLFVDLTFVEMLEKLAPELDTVEAYVVMTDRAHMPETSLPNALCYEELLEGAADSFDWPEFDETLASSLCYTSGTTGRPKGALYSHRSTVLHSFSICRGDVFSYSARDVVLPVVPMFHVNAWGIPYAAAMSGAKLVLPGADYSAPAMFELLDGERVTTSAGVPTVWFMLLEYLAKENKKLPYLERLGIGGSAVPRSMTETLQEEYGIEVTHAWGMTEISPVGTTGRLKWDPETLTREQRYEIKRKQGRAIYGVEMKIVDAEGRELPRDGEAFGELLVRGPWTIAAYYEDEEGTRAAFTEDGWFRTGDVARLDPQGLMQIVDRAKDVIKSGGEWISSIELENAAIGHPDVAEAAVIGLPHPRWDERPLLIVVAADGRAPEREALMKHLAGQVPKWWLPDDIVFLDEMPHTATGKVSKVQLREQFKDHSLPTA